MTDTRSIVDALRDHAREMERPSRIFPVSISHDGKKFHCKIGSYSNSMTNYAPVDGEGATAEEACRDFDKKWHGKE